MPLSEAKKEIVIRNYFQRLCNMNTSIKEAFTIGFNLGLEKGYAVGVNDGLKSAAVTCAKSDWKLEGGEADG